MKLLIHDYAGHPFPIQLSRELAYRGHEVVHAFAGELLTPRGALGLRSTDPAGLRIVEVPMDPNYRAQKYHFIRRRKMEIAYGTALAKLITAERANFVLSGNTPSEPQETARGAAQYCGASFIPWVQDFYAEAVSRLARKKLPVIGRFVGAYYRHIERRTMMLSSHIIAITDDFRPLLRGYGVSDSRITVIPNWAPLNELPVRPRNNTWSAKHSLNGKFCFLYSGTLAMKHNPDLLRQLALQFRADPNVAVVVISEGPGSEFLAEAKRNESLENLLLLPYQDFADLPDVLGSADVLVAVLEPDAGVFSVPSKVLTYLCAQRALLAAIPPDNLASKIIRGSAAGFTVRPDRMADFLSAAARLQESASLRARYAAAARAYAQKHFDIQRIADRFETIFLSSQQTAWSKNHQTFLNPLDASRI